MNRVRFQSISFLLLVLLSGCGHGPKVENGNVEVFYKDGATKEEAQRLAAHLAKEPAAQRRSFQLAKSPEGYQFRMVLGKDFQNDPKTHASLAFDAARASRDALNGAAVELHVCDEYFKTLKTIPPRADVRFGVLEKKVEVFFADDADRADASRLAKHFAVAFGELPGTFKIAKRGPVYEVHMVTKAEMLKDEPWVASMRNEMADISTKVFAGAPTEIHLCDEYFTVVRVVK